MRRKSVEFSFKIILGFKSLFLSLPADLIIIIGHSDG